MRNYHVPLPVFLVAVAALGAVTPLRAQSAAPDTVSAQSAQGDSASTLFRVGQAAYRENTSDGRARAIAAWEEAARRFGNTGHPRDQANTLSWICRARKEQGPSTPALESCRAALRAYEANGTPADLGKTHSRLGDLHRALAQPDSALPHYRAATLFYRQAGDSVNAGPAMEQVALIHYRAGRTDSALAAFAELVVLRRWVHDTAGEATAHDWLGSLFRKRGDSEAALEHYRASMLLYAAIGQDSVARRLHLSLGELFDSLGLDDSTIVHLTSAIGTPPPRSIAWEAWALRRLALLHLMHNAPDTALVLFREAQARYHQAGDSAGEAWALVRIASIHFSANRLDSAVAAHTSAAALRHQIHDSAGEARAHDWLGFLEGELGRNDIAIAHYRVALPLYAATEGDTAARRIHRAIGAIFEEEKLLDSATAHQILSLGDPPVGTLDAEARLLSRLGNRYLDRDVADSAALHLNAALRLVNAGADTGARKLLLRSLGRAYEKLERYDSAATALRAGITLGRATGDSGYVSSASGWLGNVEDERHNTPAAIAAYRDAIDWFPAASSPLYVAVMQVQLDRLLGQQRVLDSMRVVYEVVRPLYARLRPDSVRWRAFRGLSDLLDLRLTDSAIAHLTAPAASATLTGDRVAEVRALQSIADYFIEADLPDSVVAHHRATAALLAAGTGSLESAAARYRLIITRLSLTQDSAALSTANAWLGMIETARHQTDAAIAAYRKAILAYPAGGDPKALGGLHSVIGQLLEKVGQLDSMQAHYRIATDAGLSTFADSALVMLSRGSTYASRRWRARAITTLLEAADLMKRKGSQGLRNVALLRVALIYRDMGQLDSALVYGKIVLASWHRLRNRSEEASALMTVSGLHLQRGEFDSALTSSAAGLALAPENVEPRLIATLHGVRSVAFSSSGRYDSALVNARGAVAAWHNADDPQSLARSLGHLGSIFRAVGQYDSAITYHRAMRSGAQALSSPRLEEVALQHLAGDFESAGATDSALSTYRAVRDLARADTNARGEAAALERIGGLLLSRGATDSAAASLRAALAALLAADGSRLTAEGLNDVASLYDRIGEADSALTYHRQARDLARATGDRAALDLALVALGRLETHRGRSDEGLAALREALDRQRGNASLEETAALLGNIGFTLRRLPKPDLAGALAAFDTASVYRARVRQEAGGDENKLSIAEQFTLPPGEWEQAWLALAPRIGPDAAALGALAAAERSRAQALLDLMRGTTTARKPGTDLVAEGRRLVTAAGASGASLLSYLSTEDSLILWYARPGTPVIARVVPVGADSLARLVGSWRRALGVDHAEIGARLAGPDGAPLEEALRSGAAGAVGAVGDPIAFGMAISAIILPEELRRSARSASPRELVIVTHGPLTVIPFAALPLADSGAVLAERHAIRYAPSLTSLVEVERGSSPLRGTARAARLKRALVVGDPQMPSPRNGSGEKVVLPGLPAAGAEGRAVAQRVGVTALTGAAATERTIRDHMPAAPLIHLATHGYAYAASGQARNSFVALAPDSTDDGLLTVGEVLDDPRLKLTADLVVLSACQTGLGNLKLAEGTVGLQRAFMARGARSLLVSLWSVSDEATALLMERFYQHWLGDRDQPDKAEALRRAQADVRGTKGFEAPRFWAPFQLVGGR